MIIPTNYDVAFVSPSDSPGSRELRLTLFSRLKGLSKDRIVEVPLGTPEGILPPLQALSAVIPKIAIPPPCAVESFLGKEPIERTSARATPTEIPVARRPIASIA